MPNANDYFPSQFLKASDLKGRQVTVTIDRIEYEPVGREKTMKPVIYFVGKEKGMVMNRTNCNAIIKIAESPVGIETHCHPRPVLRVPRRLG